MSGSSRAHGVPPDPAFPPSPGDGGELFDFAVVLNYLGYALRSVRRHRLLAASCFFAILGAAVLSLLLLPKTYRVRATLLALRNPAMSALSNPGLYRPYESDAPTRGVREIILGRESLVALIKQVDLVNKYQETRAPAIRFQDALVALVSRRERTSDEKLDAMVERLEKRLTVDTSDGTVTIQLEWPHAQTALSVVDTATQNFLESRHSTEIAMVGDVISVLESHSAAMQVQIDKTIDELSRREPKRRAAVRVPVARPAPQNPELAEIKAQYASKLRAISELEDLRRRRIADLQAQLAQYQASFADQHPAVRNAKQAIELLSGPSPQLSALRHEAEALEIEIIRRGGAAGSSIEAAAPVTVRDAPLVAASPLDREDPRLEYERNQLRLLLQNQSSTLERIQAARLELDTARAAFKYRYGIVKPPQLPKRPDKPSVPIVLAIGLVAGVLFALFAAALVDVRSGVAFEAWQVERQLELPVLAEVP